jgi:DNA-binding MarR family transcriptional regulator
MEDLDLKDYRALAEFRYRIRAFLAFSEEMARSFGLEPHQHQLLLAIKGFGQEGKLTIGEVAHKLKLRHHSAVELVDRAERGGLVERVRANADRRQVFVQLTERGEDALLKLSMYHRKELRSMGPALVGALNELSGGLEIAGHAHPVAGNDA